MVSLSMSSGYGQQQQQPLAAQDQADQAGGALAGNDDRQMIDDKCGKMPYTMPGVLHFIQHEWSRFEMERAQWDMEKAELQERLKNFRLTHGGQEPDPSTLPPDDLNELEPDQVPMDIDSMNSQPQSNVSWRQGRQLLRQYLQEIGYSETILDVRSQRVRTLLGLNADNDSGSSGAPRSLAERLLADSERAVLNAGEFLAQGQGKGKGQQKQQPTALALAQRVAAGDGSDSDEESSQVRAAPPNSNKAGGGGGEAAAAGPPLNAEEEAALNEFDFLAAGADATTAAGGQGGERNNDNWHVDQQALSRMKDQYRMEAKHKKTRQDMSSMIMELRGPLGPSDAEANLGGGGAAAGDDQSAPPRGMDADAMAAWRQGLDMLGMKASNDPFDLALECAEEADDESAAALARKWNLRYTLRSHLDCVRCMQFHPVDSVLCTGSEDGTVKLWNLYKQGPHQQGDDPKAISDLEPFYTFRGHKGTVLCLVLSPTGDMCYTGGSDGTVRCWALPPTTVDMYDKYDPSLLAETLVGHHDAVWSVAFHSSDNRLISAAADGTLKLWEPQAGIGAGHEPSAAPLLKSFGAPSAEAVPTCVDFVSAEPNQVLTAYHPGTASILDLETGKTVLSFDCAADDGKTARLSAVASHPTMSVSVTAGEDRRIRYFDNTSGQLIHWFEIDIHFCPIYVPSDSIARSTVAHMEAISSVALDPNGLYLLSGAHDGSLRLWNMEKRVCLQEIAAHRRKWDESVLAVAFHPSRALIGSAGADALAKVYA